MVSSQRFTEARCLANRFLAAVPKELMHDTNPLG
jgi:hypothetical protein